MKPSRRLVVVIAAGLAAAAILAYAVSRIWKHRFSTHVEPPPAAQVAPPDLAEHREAFQAGVEAVQNGETEEAVNNLSSFSFEGRAVEEYRLYFLANAFQLQQNHDSARRTLAALWSRDPKLVFREDVGFNLGSLYAERGQWHAAADVFGRVAAKAENPTVAAAARERYIEMKLRAGDPGAILVAASNLFVENPKSVQAPNAGTLLNALRGAPESEIPPLSVTQRLDRAENLARDEDPQASLAELSILDGSTLSVHLRDRWSLARGNALHKLRRFAESDKLLEPLFAGEYRFAIPALEISARNNRVIASSIDPFDYKKVKERKRVGTEKVRRKGKKTITRPRYQTVTHTVKLVNLQKKQKKEEHRRRYMERLNDLLQLPTPAANRKNALAQLIGLTAERNDEDKLQSLVTDLVRLEPGSDVALQRFWDKGWAAYLRGDLTTARIMFLFIANTYRSYNIQRQSKYWYARSLERAKEKEKATEIYQELANAPYDDLYVLFSERRGAKRTDPKQGNPLQGKGLDWPEIAEKEMPAELRLAYELSALGLGREARLEAQHNSTDRNRKYADTILGEMFYTQGAVVAGYKFLLRAYPELGTVKQDMVPRRILAMYYPLRYVEKIRAEAAKRDLDPHLVMGLIRQESIYDPEARSPVGARGLMQLMPPTAREIAGKTGNSYSESRLTDPELNIELGAYYLRWLINLNGGNVELSLASYNGGLGNVRRWKKAAPSRPMDEFIESMPFPETRGYVKRITLYRSTYRRIAGGGG